jgi:polysaccharide deacetylase family protein (PEP-CTERM system associated)
MIRNALTVDVEDYFHVSAFAQNIRRRDWDHYESRIEKNTHKLLDIFAQHDCRATFFVLGWVAERYPRLVRDIAKQGHEIACHGYDHELIYDQTPDAFRSDTLRAKNAIENVIRTPVEGYRAASFSITKQSLWALDILAELGFRYDSSVFPVRHDRYGLPQASDQPHPIKTPGAATLIEFPLTTANFLGYRLPIAGGGYFRLYPYAFTRWNLRRINGRGKPFVFYIHPWEIDPQQPRVHAASLSSFRHYNNLDKCEARLLCLLSDFKFATMKSVLADVDL